MHWRRAACILLSALCAVTPTARATWSIVVVDTRTGEVGIGSATCLLNFDLQRNLPVVIPEIGAAAAQALVDSGRNRVLIWVEMHLGTDPQTILMRLAAGDGRHQSRQYGIVDTQGRALSFTGSETGAYANGLTGRAGTLVYAIQGNLITGQGVLDDAEQALVSTPGALPERLMAAMEAARARGGDARCSCPGQPPPCNPPPNAKSAHIGFMVVTRRGDPEGRCTASTGCANGGYYMALNILADDPQDPDPVFQLRERFDAWRASLVGRPDAVESLARIDPQRIVSDGAAAARLRIELRDWRGQPVADTPAIFVAHDRDSAGSSTIGTVRPLGNGVYEVPLTAGTVCGRDRLAVQLVNDVGVQFLMPSPELLLVDPRADLNRDQRLDQADLGILLASFGRDAGGDIDGDGDTDQSDLGLLLTAWNGGCL